MGNRFCKPALKNLLTFHIPNLMSIFLSLCGLSKEFNQVRGLSLPFYGEEFLSLCPTPKLENHPSHVHKGDHIGYISVGAYIFFYLFLINIIILLI
jgi:hypothetical protein